MGRRKAVQKKAKGQVRRRKPPVQKAKGQKNRMFLEAVINAAVQSRYAEKLTKLAREDKFGALIGGLVVAGVGLLFQQAHFLLYLNVFFVLQIAEVNGMTRHSEGVLERIKRSTVEDEKKVEEETGVVLYDLWNKTNPGQNAGTHVGHWRRAVALGQLALATVVLYAFSQDAGVVYSLSHLPWLPLLVWAALIVLMGWAVVRAWKQTDAELSPSQRKRRDNRRAFRKKAQQKGERAARADFRRLGSAATAKPIADIQPNVQSSEEQIKAEKNRLYCMAYNEELKAAQEAALYKAACKSL
jgi:hypothetical protein